MTIIEPTSIRAPILIKPNKIDTQTRPSFNDVYASEMEETIIIEPFDSGFGLSVANFLRRVMLSATPGFAITSYSIPGVFHDFSSLEGVLEDCLEIGLNLGKIALHKPTFETEEFIIKTDEEGSLYARALESSGCTVFNPDHVICRLTRKRHLEIKVRIAYGSGSLLAEDQPIEDGWVHMNTYFSPVRRVGFHIEKMRVGEKVDCERVIFNITTNHSISALKALQCACAVAVDQYQAISNINRSYEVIMPSEYHQVREESLDATVLVAENSDMMKRNLGDLGFDKKTVEQLADQKIHTLEDLLQYSEEELYASSAASKKVIEKIRVILTGLGLDLKVSSAS